MILSQPPLFYLVAVIAVVLVGLAKGGFAGLGAAATPLLVLLMVALGLVLVWQGLS